MRNSISLIPGSKLPTFKHFHGLQKQLLEVSSQIDTYQEPLTGGEGSDYLGCVGADGGHKTFISL
jgi:hypothetical protein